MDFEESKDEGCCSINFLKYVLYMFYFVFMVSLDHDFYQPGV